LLLSSTFVLICMLRQRKKMFQNNSTFAVVNNIFQVLNAVCFIVEMVLTVIDLYLILATSIFGDLNDLINVGRCFSRAGDSALLGLFSDFEQKKTLGIGEMILSLTNLVISGFEIYYYLKRFNKDIRTPRNRDTEAAQIEDLADIGLIGVDVQTHEKAFIQLALQVIDFYLCYVEYFELTKPGLEDLVSLVGSLRHGSAVEINDVTVQPCLKAVATISNATFSTTTSRPRGVVWQRMRR